VGEGNPALTMPPQRLSLRSDSFILDIGISARLSAAAGWSQRIDRSRVVGPWYSFDRLDEVHYSYPTNLSGFDPSSFGNIGEKI
jgi:hypothetical protein